jgi:hypothetical protein
VNKKVETLPVEVVQSTLCKTIGFDSASYIHYTHSVGVHTSEPKYSKQNGIVANTRGSRAKYNFSVFLARPVSYLIPNQ